MSEKFLLELEKAIKSTLLELFDKVLIDGIFTEQAEISDLNLLKIVIFIKNPTELREYIEKEFVPFKDQIKSHNIDYFRDNFDIFKNIKNQSKLNYYSDKIYKGISKEEQDVIFEYLVTIIDLCELCEEQEKSKN